ncbi:hypothetical protein HK101_000461 [Irineochytrium annulatum]|nr:hypothetical protein HK101_000461 [Irineochytrium annulatum]
MGIDCTTATCQVVLSYIIPALGDVTGLLLFLAPIPAVRLALAQGKLGSLNPIPFALITVNCLGWIVYGLYIKNYFVFVTNWIGWALGTWFCLSLRPLMPAAQVRIVEVILLGVSMAVYLLSAISFISLGEESAKLTLGFMTNVILVAFYGSPLTVMWEVVRERDSSGLNTAIAVTSLINSSLWVVYGQVIVDWFITVPNALGVIFSVTQLILLGIYPRRKANAAAGAPASTSEKNLTLEAGEPEIIQIEDDVPDVEGNYLKAR